MWKKGSGSQNRSPAVRPKRRATLIAVRTSASCVIRQPFGRAVVPDVYIRIATSRTRTDSRRRRTSAASTPAPAAAKAARSRYPSGEDEPSRIR